jgi:hypothetical protein
MLKLLSVGLLSILLVPVFNLPASAQNNIFYPIWNENWRLINEQQQQERYGNTNNNSAPRFRSPNASSSTPSGQFSLILTQNQKQKIQSIRQGSATQVMAVLTPDQQTKLQQAAQSNSASIMAVLDLTPEQKTKIQAIQANEGQKIKSVLTADQIKILQNRTSAPK